LGVDKSKIIRILKNMRTKLFDRLSKYFLSPTACGWHSAEHEVMLDSSAASTVFLTEVMG
jgi:hypothetical protein